MELTQGVRFDTLELSPEILRALMERNIVQSTPVQAGCIPPMLEWRDVIAKAPTGTGKTFAYGIPIVEHIDPEDESVQAVILAPTRELAIQITDELRILYTYKPGIRAVCLYGGAPIGRQIDALKKHPAAILLGIFAGVLACCGTIWLMSRLFGLSRGVYATLLPKSITTAIGMDLSDQLGGSANVTVACIIFTGLFGNLAASSFLKLCRITDPIAVGLAIGTSSHALGTSRAHELGRTQEAMSSLSIAVAGLMTVAAASVFANLY